MKILDDANNKGKMTFSEFQNQMPNKFNLITKVTKWVKILSLIYSFAKEIFILFLAYKFLIQ